MPYNTRDRFYSKTKLNPASGCLEWAAGCFTTGYGAFYLNGKNRLAHRIAWELNKGIIPAGKVLDHLCRNRCCVNVDHLEIVSHRENILRSPIAPPALNIVKLHCNRGHPLAGANLYLHADGHRECRECSRAKWRRYYYRHHERLVSSVRRKRAHEKRMANQ